MTPTTSREMIIGVPMFTAYLIVTIFAAAANIFSASCDFIRYKQVSIAMAKAGVPESWMTTLGILKAAGAFGLLVGLRVTDRNGRRHRTHPVLCRRNHHPPARARLFVRPRNHVPPAGLLHCITGARNPSRGIDCPVAGTGVIGIVYLQQIFGARQEWTSKAWTDRPLLGTGLGTHREEKESSGHYRSVWRRNEVGRSMNEGISPGGAEWLRAIVDRVARRPALGLRQPNIS